MKELISLLLNDYKSQNFTKKEYVNYGIVLPVALFALCWLGGFISQL